MNDTFFDGLGEDRTTRAGCRCEKMVFLSLFLFVFFVTLRGRRAVHSSGAQFEQAFSDNDFSQSSLTQVT